MSRARPTKNPPAGPSPAAIAALAAATRAGTEARCLGHEMADCPHPRGSASAGAWLRGWQLGVPPNTLSEVWTDAGVAAELGVSTETVARLRNKLCGPDDTRQVRGTLLFTAGGRAKIRRALEVHLRDEPLAPAAAGERALGFTSTRVLPISPITADLTVTRVVGTSTQLLAEHPNGNEIALRVRDTRHLRPGMVLRGCVQDEMGWTYHGRLPRSLGERQLFFPAARSGRHDQEHTQ